MEWGLLEKVEGTMGQTMEVMVSYFVHCASGGPTLQAVITFRPSWDEGYIWLGWVVRQNFNLFSFGLPKCFQGGRPLLSLAKLFWPESKSRSRQLGLMFMFLLFLFLYICLLLLFYYLFFVSGWLNGWMDVCFLICLVALRLYFIILYFYEGGYHEFVLKRGWWKLFATKHLIFMISYYRRFCRCLRWDITPWVQYFPLLYIMEFSTTRNLIL